MKNAVKRISLAVALVGGAMILGEAPARAGEVSSRSGLAGNGTTSLSGTLDWGHVGSFGEQITNLSGTQVVVSIPGASSVVGAPDSVTTDISGNGVIIPNYLGSNPFDSTTPLYLGTFQQGKGSEPVNLSFSVGLLGVGTQILPFASIGPFSAILTTYGSDGTILNTFTENSDGSVIFIGALDQTADISRVTIGLKGKKPSAFLINDVTLLADPPPAAPEPSTLISGAIACVVGLGVVYRRRRASV